MRSSDFLFRLIKSLSKGDRRNFKLFARLQDGDKQYIRLFDAIDRQEEYDEELLLKEFEGERFTKQFSVMKNYLYNYILKTMHVFKRDAQTELNMLLHQVQILVSKNLFDQADKLLRKAKHMAERHERFQENLYVLNMERHLLFQRRQNKLFEAYINDIQANERLLLEKAANLQAYEHLYDEVYRIMKQSATARSENARQRIEGMLQEPIIADPTKALSGRAQIKRLDFLYDVYRFTGRWHECLNSLLALLEVFETRNELREEKSLGYIRTISNIGAVQYKLGQFDEAILMLEKLKAAPVTTEEEELHVFEKYYHFKIALLADIFALEDGLKVIKEYETAAMAFDGKLTKSTELSTIYSITNFFIVAGMPREALYWVNKIINEPKTELRMDVQAIARIFNVIIHYELGDRDFLEYNIKSATRFLANREHLFGFERTILKYIRQLSLLYPNENATSVFQAFREEILHVTKDPFEQKGLVLFDIIAWIDSKIYSTRMIDILSISAKDRVGK
jgi:hypothetical protein